MRLCSLPKGVVTSANFLKHKKRSLFIVNNIVSFKLRLLVSAANLFDQLEHLRKLAELSQSDKCLVFFYCQTI